MCLDFGRIEIQQTVRNNPRNCEAELEKNIAELEREKEYISFWHLHEQGIVLPSNIYLPSIVPLLPDITMAHDNIRFKDLMHSTLCQMDVLLVTMCPAVDNVVSSSFVQDHSHHELHIKEELLPQTQRQDATSSTQNNSRDYQQMHHSNVIGATHDDPLNNDSHNDGKTEAFDIRQSDEVIVLTDDEGHPLVSSRSSSLNYNNRTQGVENDQIQNLSSIPTISNRTPTKRRVSENGMTSSCTPSKKKKKKKSKISMIEDAEDVPLNAEGKPDVDASSIHSLLKGRGQDGFYILEKIFPG